MRFHQTNDPDVLATKYGSRIVFNIVFFLLLFGFGMAAMLAGLGAFGLEWEAQSSPLFGFLLGGALCALGLASLTYRRGLVLDRRRGLLTKWRSMFGLRQEKTMAVEEIKRILLRREVDESHTTSGRRIRHAVYSVIVDGRADIFKFCDEATYKGGLATAEHAAQALGAELEDRSDETVRKTAWW